MRIPFGGPAVLLRTDIINQSLLLAQSDTTRRKIPHSTTLSLLHPINRHHTQLHLFISCYRFSTSSIRFLFLSLSLFLLRHILSSSTNGFLLIHSLASVRLERETDHKKYPVDERIYADSENYIWSSKHTHKKFVNLITFSFCYFLIKLSRLWIFWRPQKRTNCCCCCWASGSQYREWHNKFLFFDFFFLSRCRRCRFDSIRYSVARV